MYFDSPYNNVDSNLHNMHHFLMKNGFPYKSVSVIYRGQDLGYHIFISKEFEHLITDEIKSNIELSYFNYSVNKER